VKDLIELRYLEEVAPRKGYRLGPGCYSLSMGKEYREDLRVAAGPEVKKLSEKIKESVLIAVLNKSRRYIICHHNGNPEIQVIIDRPYYEDIYRTATGRLLLAFAGEDEGRSYIEKHGFPGGIWNNITMFEAFDAELAKIRADGMVLDTSKQLSIMAYPVFCADGTVAALGVSVPRMNFRGVRKKTILSEALKTAEKISSNLK
jgi:DNA-binding IclR family transcriptional regulator